VTGLVWHGQYGGQEMLGWAKTRDLVYGTREGADFRRLSSAARTEEQMNPERHSTQSFDISGK
jgi:hypothetical protein